MNSKTVGPRRTILFLVLVTLLASVRSAGVEPVLARADDLRIPPAEYRQRRVALLAALADAIVVLRGTTEDEFGDVGRFSQSNDFMYLTGCETPGAYVVLNPYAAAGERDVLYLPGRDVGKERWTGPQRGPGTEAARVFGFEQVRDADSLDKDLAEALQSKAVRARLTAKQPVRLATVVPSGPNAAFARETALVARLGSAMVVTRSEVTLLDVSPILGELRRTKSPGELALLRRAIDITGEAQAEVARTLSPGVFEYEIESAIVAAFLRNGAMRAGFPSIVGSGVYSTVLHYNRNDKRIEHDDLVVVDIGASFRYYTADVTRTFPASGTFSPRQREVYQLVLDAQRAAEDAYKPGATIFDLHRAAVAVMRESPLRDGDGKTLDRYFIHGLSHFLGMDVHDVGNIATPLKVGDVFTIEPGIYITSEKLGVRIEDDYLVTPNGLEKLSRDIPSGADEIERLMREARTRR